MRGLGSLFTMMFLSRRVINYTLEQSLKSARTPRLGRGKMQIRAMIGIMRAQSAMYQAKRDVGFWMKMR